MQDRPARERTSLCMGSRLLPLALAAGALLAYGLGFQRGGSYLVLLAVPAAAAAAFVAVADVMEGKDARLRAAGSCLALGLLLVGALAQSSAPAGGAVPALALSSLVGTMVVYTLPLLGWLLEPLRPQRRDRTPLRTAPAHADVRTAEAA